MKSSPIEELYASDDKKSFLRDMLKGLSALQWNRTDVYFRSYFSHEKIVNKRTWWFDNGQDVVELLIQKFLQ